MIECRGLGKDFRQFKKEPGLMGSLKTFFTRSYDIKPAVKAFDLCIEPGEMIGLLGPNGAGKTTLMKMFTGIIVPSYGELKVFGHTPFQREQSFRKKIALVMGQKSQLWWDIPAMDSFLLLQKYYEIPHADFKRRLNELSSLLEVEPLLKVHVRKLSLGERMKMELMACLLHQPSVLFLDEPTIGLDLVAQRNIRDFIADYQQKNKTTVILTSHYMADVDALCSRIVLVLAGEKRYDGKITDFANILGREKVLSIGFRDPLGSEQKIGEGFDPQWNESRTRVDLRIPEDKVRELAIKVLEDYPVTEFSLEKMPIERVMSALLANPKILQRESEHA